MVVEHQFDMADLDATAQLLHRTALIRLGLTRRQTGRCYGLLRSAGDVWAWLVDLNRQRLQQDAQPVTGYPALCRELTAIGGFGELSVVGARSVLHRYADAWREAARRRRNGQHARFPRRKRAMVPVRFYRGTFLLEEKRVRLPVAKDQPELWVRLARPIPYPAEQVRAVTLLHDGGRLWLAVTAAIPIQQDHDLDPALVAGVDLGIIHPYAVVTRDAGLLVSGRAIRAENYLHLRDQQARQARVARRAPKPRQRGSRRWRRHRARVRQVEARHRRRVHQAQHEAARQVIAFAVRQRVGIMLVGDPKGITDRDAGRAHNLRLRQWRRTSLAQALRDKAEEVGIEVRLVDERGTSSTCPACRQRVPKPKGREFHCRECGFKGHRDLVGAQNIAVKHGGGNTSAGLPVLVEHRRAGIVPARRDRRRHLHDGGRGPARPQASQMSAQRLLGVARRTQGSYPAFAEDQAASPRQAHVARRGTSTS